MLNRVLDQLHCIERELTGDVLFYRGHSDATWQLLPSLARKAVEPNLESILYYDFVTRAGSLLPIDDTGWTHIFAMQHHGIQTRLLDWTTTFGVALYFATREGHGDAAVWVLDPFELNKITWGSATLPTPGELDTNYYDTFISEGRKIPAKVVAISPIRLSPRVFNQRAAFTLHVDLKEPLEIMCPDVIRKVTIPDNMRVHAKEFLRLAGISEYSLFPDLDGLARDLLSEHL